MININLFQQGNNLRPNLFINIELHVSAQVANNDIYIAHTAGNELNRLVYLSSFLTGSTLGEE